MKIRNKMKINKLKITMKKNLKICVNWEDQGIGKMKIQQ